MPGKAQPCWCCSCAEATLCLQQLVTPLQGCGRPGSYSQRSDSPASNNLVNVLHVAIGTGSAAAETLWQKVFVGIPSAQELWEHDADNLQVINYAPLDPAAPAKAQEQFKQQQLKAQAACTDLMQTCLHNDDVEMAKLLFASVAASHMGESGLSCKLLHASSFRCMAMRSSDHPRQTNRQ